MRGRLFTRGEDIAIIAMRLLTDMSLREIGEAIGRDGDTVGKHLDFLGMRADGWRTRATVFLTQTPSYTPPPMR